LGKPHRSIFEKPGKKPLSLKQLAGLPKSAGVAETIIKAVLSEQNGAGTTILLRRRFNF
jgi:hypothetical protein